MCEIISVKSERAESAFSNMLDRAAKIVNAGGVIICPTDTHYTLLARADRQDAVARIYEAKKRERAFPLTIFVAHPQDVTKIAQPSVAVQELITRYWPGLLTLILPKRSNVIPDYVTAGLPTAAVACHKHPLLAAIITLLDGFAACTSANLSGQGDQLVTLEQAVTQLGDCVDMIVDGGPAETQQGNSIVDLTGNAPILVRRGSIDVDELKQLFPNIEDKEGVYKMEIKRQWETFLQKKPRLEGKVAFITGAARGRGAAIARVFAKEGAVVIVSDLSESGKTVVDELATVGKTARFCLLDVTKFEDWSKAVTEVVNEFGKIDILVNNAGYFGMPSSVEPDIKGWELNWNINASGAYIGASTVMAHMEKGGTVVNISSIFGLLGTEWAGIAYQTSKGALLSLTRALAVKWAHKKIRVNAVCPGLIPTPMTEQLFKDPQVKSEILKRIPLGREVSPEDIAHAALFLASDEAGYITGAVLPVDGGMAAS